MMSWLRFSLTSGDTKAFSEILSSSPTGLTLGMNLEVNLFLLFGGTLLPPGEMALGTAVRSASGLLCL